MRSVPYDSHDWHEFANCATTDPDIFFPEKGDSSRAAREICSHCEVARQCLADALGEGGRQVGVRGGLTARDRKLLLRGKFDFRGGEFYERVSASG